MEEIFDCLIDSYIRDKVGIAENFLSAPLAAHLTENLKTLFANQQLKSAGIGNAIVASQDKLVRSDVIYWLDRTHENQYENDFFDLMDKFVLYLNQTCYTGITGYEFHYTLYDPGTFYKKHIDQFKNNGSRQYSMIMYLNIGWAFGDGGELCIYHLAHTQNISPDNGKSVFFKSSDLAHEVLVTSKQRLSITGWLKID
ncbi:2OG-Fe(II) oxygenase [Pedobacter petrophilus]|uniref:2OG-Fe(II) oxygenase n=1 Tax=Pedobacter petrophilus TaxID=1908241 RepID=A0A7K0G3A2_9SPHI|nr:2OG-Fe(II) oxygenase [Pedobacter petrophilus]MRX78112.1 2OG-Fe(II) oxygenase [Pedobacter petrophilus]